MRRPTLLRIPFSHFCRKAEWGLTQAGIAYDTRDLQLWQMRHVHLLHPGGTVPVLRVGDRLLTDSHDILVWADEHRAAGAPALYPPAIAHQVVAWERWAGEALGPVTRREAYRQLHKRPALGRAYGLPFWMTLSPARRLYLAVLRHYKARRHEAADPQALREGLTRVAGQLARSGTPYLFGQQPTAADVTTAALLEPMQVVAAAGGYVDHPGWQEVAAYLQRVRPATTTVVRTRHGSVRLLRAWAAQTTPQGTSRDVDA